MCRSSPRKRLSRKAANSSRSEVSVEVGVKASAAVTVNGATTKVSKRKVTEVSYAEEDDEQDDISEEEVKTAKKRKTASSGTGKAKAKAKGKAADDMKPFLPRTAVATLKKAMYIGAHVSGAGGVHNSIQNATQIGANAFALFLKSQRKWTNPPLDPSIRDQYRKAAAAASYDSALHVLPHGSYLVNLAQADTAKSAQAYASFVDDLKRCDELGIRLYNFHPGNSGGEDKKVACGRIAKMLNKAHKETKQVVTVLENMAGAGNVLGAKFEELRDIIAGVEDKKRVAVCIDTCHAFAAGYDIRTAEAFEKTMKEFDDVVGLDYLKAFHLNDSKAPLGSNRDLHANIGTGFIGLRAFHALVNTDRFAGLPMVLETPIDRKGPDGKAFEDKKVWADEIKLLEGLIGADPESDEFAALEARLQEEGRTEREKIQDQVDRKVAKDKKAAEKKGQKGKAKGKKKIKEETTDEESD